MRSAQAVSILNPANDIRTLRHRQKRRFKPADANARQFLRDRLLGSALAAAGAWVKKCARSRANSPHVGGVNLACCWLR